MTSPSLADQAAVELVGAVLRAARPDDDRIAGDPEAARQLAEACGGLPLALRITAALLAADRFEEAIGAHRDAAAIFREGGDQRREGIALDNMKSVPASTS